MTTLGEDAEAFFRSGDEGTYEGGPATVIPVALPDDSAEHVPLVAVEEQLERRRRLTRVVATFVGGLGTGVLLLGAWLVASSARATEAAPPRFESVPQAAHVAAAPAAPVKVEPVVPVATSTVPEPVAPAEPAATAARVEPARVQKPVVTRAGRSSNGEGRALVVPTTRRVVPVQASFGVSKPVSHGPPTANFPD